LESLPVDELKGVGAQTAARLKKLGIGSVADLLFHVPVRYEDRTRIFKIAQVIQGQQVLIQGRIQSVELLTRGRRSLICRINDGSGFLAIRLFHFSTAQRNALCAGDLLRCYGEVRIGYDGKEMIHPEYQCLRAENSAVVDTKLTPVYRLTEGVRQKTLRRLVKESLDRLQSSDSIFELSEWIPSSVLNEMALPGLVEALSLLHAPEPEIGDSFLNWQHPAQKRLILEELVAHHLSLTQARTKLREQKAPIVSVDEYRLNLFLGGLPFELTAAQRRVVSEIHEDIVSNRPMMRLVHGDVGSGKTVVAACCSLAVMHAGYQVALMAPTELLALQHYRKFDEWLSGLGIRTVCLVGKQSEKTRSEINAAIACGDVGFVIGTHALYQDKVNFHRLGLVIIDEQHRFGVHQRLALREKGRRDGLYPHQLIMTATPIPRTLAMLRFADLDVSVIDQLPAGRTPVETVVIPSARRLEVVDRIDQWVSGGRQVYWVCTLIEESEVLQCEAVENTHALLVDQLPGIQIGLVHGKLKSAQKEAVMQAFLDHEIDVLVATTVIEVGVDVPNAGLMIIENPERLGLAQLHQLRGRVGRGPGESFCVLMYQTPLSQVARERLAVLRETSDGFKIAEKDLELRGSGEVMGVRQTGQIQFRIADLFRDKDLLPDIVCTAELIRRDYPANVTPLIHRWVGDATQYAEV